MKAKLIKSLRLNGQIVAPLPNNRVTLVDLSEKEFDRLNDMGKVTRPDEDDLKVGTLVGQAIEAPADEDAPADEEAPAPKKSAAKLKADAKTETPASGTDTPIADL